MFTPAEHHDPRHAVTGNWDISARKSGADVSPSPGISPDERIEPNRCSSRNPEQRCRASAPPRRRNRSPNPARLSRQHLDLDLTRFTIHLRKLNHNADGRHGNLHQTNAFIRACAREGRLPAPTAFWQTTVLENLVTLCVHVARQPQPGARKPPTGRIGAPSGSGKGNANYPKTSPPAPRRSRARRKDARRAFPTEGTRGERFPTIFTDQSGKWPTSADATDTAIPRVFHQACRTGLFRRYRYFSVKLSFAAQTMIKNPFAIEHRAAWPPSLPVASSS